MRAANLAILMTPPGAAAIAVVRLKGPAVEGFLKAHFSKAAVRGRCVHAELTDGSRVIDDAVVALCDQTTADVNLHGGPWVVRSVLDLAGREGFEVLDAAGPVPDAALDANTELEREVLASLPLARTELGVRVLLGQTRAWEQLKQQAATGSETLPAELGRVLADPTLRHLLHPPRVAIIGAANVGKSTLANQLFARERSITADLPGTTRDWVGEIANLDGLPVMLVDTPGMRVTDDAIERVAIERSRAEVERAELVVLVLDASRPLEPEQALLLREYPAALRVINKIDRPPVWDIGSVDALHTAATTGQGIETLRKKVTARLCGTEVIDHGQAYVWTGRQQAIVEQAVHDPRLIATL